MASTVNRNEPSPRWLVVIVTLFASAWLVLLGHMLFVSFPTLAKTGDAQLQVWLGPQRARLAFLLIGGLITAAHIWVTVAGTRERGRLLTFPWRVGAVVGGSAGLVMVVGGVIWDLLATLYGPL